MARDLSLLFYDGEPLSMPVLATAFGEVLAGHIGKATLAIAHSRAPIRSTGLRSETSWM